MCQARRQKTKRKANNIRVRLKRSDGKEIDVPLQSLSDQDKRFVESWKKENRTSAAPRKRKDSATSAARSKKSDEPKLAPITVKIFDNELTMQAPLGATAEVQGVFPVVRFGERFVMWIEPYSEKDLPEFKERFARQSPAFALPKILVQENDALAYTVNVKAFNSTASAYMAVVTVGDKKYTCSDESLEDINRKQKYSAEDIELRIRCARTLSPKGAKSERASTPSGRTQRQR